MDDFQFQQLLQYLGLSWRGYRKVRRGVKKRIRRHMQQMRCKDVTTYLLALEENEEEKRQCERLMTVSISRFFRDRKLWEILGSEILPELIEEHKEKLNVWSAGCACGEEVYSLKILWDSLIQSFIHMPKLDIIATDMNPLYLERARAAIYSSSSLKEVPTQFRSLFFQEKSNRKRYEIAASSKKGIVWQEHRFGAEPPGSQFHMIFLRNNLLTYYQDEFKKSVFEKTVNCLSRGGILIIGSHEELPLERPDLLPCCSVSYVFRKRL